jgi:hypothetical protein
MHPNCLRTSDGSLVNRGHLLVRSRLGVAHIFQNAFACQRHCPHVFGQFGNPAIRCKRARPNRSARNGVVSPGEVTAVGDASQHTQRAASWAITRREVSNAATASARPRPETHEVQPKLSKIQPSTAVSARPPK